MLLLFLEFVDLNFKVIDSFSEALYLMLESELHLLRFVWRQLFLARLAEQII